MQRSTVFAATSSARGSTCPFVRVSGTVTEVAPALYRVSGLSRFVNLGEIVALEPGRRSGGRTFGEVIRIDDATGDGEALRGRHQRRHRHDGLARGPAAALSGRMLERTRDERAWPAAR